MLINYKEARVLSFPTGHTKDMITSEIHLMPGINDVPADVVKKMQDHPILKNYFEDDLIVVLQGQDGKPMTGLSSNEKEALKMVSETNHTDLLQKFSEQEKRSKVKRALDKRLNEFENPTGDKRDEE